jgi:CDP-glucose 4,6-dehydratase
MSHPLADFYRGKRILVTGHTGFEGGWAVAWLKVLGAQVCGYGLPPATRPNFFDATLLDRGMTSIFGDIRDRNSLANLFTEFQPEIVIHCAAQTNSQSSLSEPVDAFSTNVMGTVHILEEARLTHSVRATVLMSRGSCAEFEHRSKSNYETGSSRPYDLLSASMTSAELARSAFDQSFFQKTGTAVATARIADAIGGGDWRTSHIVPDLVRGLTAGEPFPARKEHELRVWHVLEPVRACLLLAQNLFEHGQKFSGVWDFAPHAQDKISASKFADEFAMLWGGDTAPAQKDSLKPSGVAKSSPDKAQAELGWAPVLSADEALAWTVEWYRGFCSDPSSTLRTTEDQLERYMRMPTA